MKSYTDLYQSKKLAEILPSESADMCFNISQRYNMPPLMTPYSKFNEFFGMEKTPDFLIPCWSLAALLDVLPYPSIHKHADETWWCDAWVDKVNPYSLRHFKTPVDACVAMIEELHEQKLL